MHATHFLWTLQRKLSFQKKFDAQKLKDYLKNCKSKAKKNYEVKKKKSSHHLKKKFSSATTMNEALQPPPFWFYFGNTLLVIYGFAVFCICVYGLLQLDLLWVYWRKRREQPTSPQYIDIEKNPPMVTIQLPMYNEQFVATRLIDCVVEMDYPRHRLEIQVLDDSTDETVDLVAERVKYWQNQGIDIVHVRRENRQGFKAGALKEGMKTAKGEFLAIFDADFLPIKDFLKKTIPYFGGKDVGVVQTRWEHLNENYSLITRLQALQLNVHFTIEQVARMKSNLMLQFNGTAGVWRKKAIEDAGGWESDTLTEDFDLSYRSQLAGYRIVYLEEVGSPAELPAEMNGLKAQQFRWMKGGAENAIKNLKRVWKASNLSFWQKFHSIQHLFGSGVFMAALTTSVLSLPLALYGDAMGSKIPKWLGIPGAIALMGIILLVFVANLQPLIRKGKAFDSAFWRVLGLVFMFIPLAAGMALHNTIAVLEGYSGKKSAFARTPKFGLTGKSGSWTKGTSYLAKKLPLSTYFEGILALYFTIGAGLEFYWKVEGYPWFHSMFAFGYWAIFIISVRHLNQK